MYGWFAAVDTWWLTRDRPFCALAENEKYIKLQNAKSRHLILSLKWYMLFSAILTILYKLHYINNFQSIADHLEVNGNKMWHVFIDNILKWKMAFN